MQTPVELNVGSAIRAAKHAAAHGPLRNRSRVTRVTSSTTMFSLTTGHRWRLGNRRPGRDGKLCLSTSAALVHTARLIGRKPLPLLADAFHMLLGASIIYALARSGFAAACSRVARRWECNRHLSLKQKPAVRSLAERTVRAFRVRWRSFPRRRCGIRWAARGRLSCAPTWQRRIWTSLIA